MDDATNGAAALDEDDRALAVAETKSVLRIGADDEDELIGTLLDSALGVAEAFLGLVLIDRTMTLRCRVARGWERFPATPVSAIGDVAAVAPDGTTTPLPVDAYALEIDSDGDGWIRLVGTRPAIVAATVSAGLAADWNSLPAAIRQGIVMLAAYLYDRRDGADAPPAAVTALWRPFRRMRLDARVPA